jgi:SAM-dependent methyltransferase
MHGNLTPSPWVQRWAHLVPDHARVLDLACGSGRHVRWLAARGHAVTAVDRDTDALAGLASVAECIAADFEAAAWPLPGRQFDAVVVTNYLWRPLWPDLLGAVAPGGVLLYETFARGNETVGRPARPEFLLEPGELLAACAGLRIVAYEHGFLTAPERFVQRVAAVRLPDASTGPARHALG